jgi:hypothetical protein
MSFDQMKKAASMGAKLELCAMGTLMGPTAHLAWMRHWRVVKVEETAAAIKEVGAQNFVLATDLGQTGNPSPADGLQLFVTDLLKAGVSKDELIKMGRKRPAICSWVDGQQIHRPPRPGLPTRPGLHQPAHREDSKSTIRPVGARGTAEHGASSVGRPACCYDRGAMIPNRTRPCT